MKTLIVLGAIVALLASTRQGESHQSDPKADSTRTIKAAFGDSSPLGKVLHRSCGDCHSNAMSSAWFTRVPPFSSVMKRGAREGRKAVNFAEWASYSPEKRRAFLVASCMDVKTGRMPGSAYLHFRGDARLTAQDIETICGASR